MSTSSRNCEKQVETIDLAEGEKYLRSDWSLQSVADWAQRKFAVKITPEELDGLSAAKVKDYIRSKVRDAYRQKEIEFPSRVAINNFLAEKAGEGAARYNRAGLFDWTKFRFPQFADQISEDDFRTQSRVETRGEDCRIQSTRRIPKRREEAISNKVADAFEGTKSADRDDAQELVTWFRSTFGLEIPGRGLDRSR